MKPLVRRAAVALGVALCVVAGIAIWSLVTGHLDATSARVLASTFMAALCVLTALVGATGLDRAGPRRWVGLATILVSAAEFALGLAVIWSGLDDEGLMRALGASSVLLPALVHASLMLGRLRPEDGPLVRGLTAAALSLSALPAVLVAGGLVLAVGSPGAGAWRLLGVDLVLATLSTLLVPIVRRLARPGTGTARPESAVGAPEPAVGEPASAVSEPESAVGEPESAVSGPGRERPKRTTPFRRSLLVNRGHAA